jgi:polyribonucleotide nucleotidyltransferase
VTLTLGSSRDVQDVDAITGGIRTKTFLLHYNFPPFCVGETGWMTRSGRREIGNGALAERSLSPIIPSEEVFPDSVRIVSDVLESNDSSPMASVCGGSLALMDAGVPILAPVSGISTGLVTEFGGDGNLERYVILTDIIGDEDHFGDMDFKICETAQGITGFQIDLKINGLPLAVAKEAISRNRAARAEILAAMLEVQRGVNGALKPSAPGFREVTIDPEKIGALIGPDGKNIKRLTEASRAQIDINEDNSRAS